MFLSHSDVIAACQYWECTETFAREMIEKLFSRDNEDDDDDEGFVFDAEY